MSAPSLNLDYFAEEIQAAQAASEGRHGTWATAYISDVDILVAEVARLRTELERTTGDWEVAIREAAAARAELAAMGDPVTEYGSASMCFNGQETTNWGDQYWVGSTLGRTVRRGPEWIVDHDVERAALDQRLTR